MKTRSLTKDEINKITERCKIREQAFFTIMRQSGLTPYIIKQLKIKNLEKILETDTPIPCKINVPQEKQKEKFRTPPAFIGYEGTEHLKQYLKTDREDLTTESLLFTIHNNPNKEINTKDVSRAFKQTAEKLKKDKIIMYEDKKEGKANTIRLYNLINYYKTNAKEYLTEVKNNPNREDEFYRKLYKENTMIHLEIETPSKTEIIQLKDRLEKIENKINPKPTFVINNEWLQNYAKRREEKDKYEKEHAEELNKEWERKYNTPETLEKSNKAEKYAEEFLKSPEGQTMLYLEELNKRLNEHPEQTNQIYEELTKYSHEHPEIEKQEHEKSIELHIWQLESENYYNQQKIDRLEKTVIEITKILKEKKETKNNNNIPQNTNKINQAKNQTILLPHDNKQNTNPIQQPTPQYYA